MEAISGAGSGLVSARVVAAELVLSKGSWEVQCAQRAVVWPVRGPWQGQGEKAVRNEGWKLGLVGREGKKI